MSSIKKISGVVLISAMLALVGCSDSDSPNTGGLGGGTTGGGTTGGGTTGGGTVSAVANLSVALTDNAGQTITTISSGSPATVKATVKNAAGATVANAVVTFTIDTAGLAVLTPSSGTALTNSSGVATVSLAAASLFAAGAATVTAAAQVGADAVTGSQGFAVGAASVTMNNFIFGVGTAALSAYGSTSVSVSVSTNGVLVKTPQTVTFTSACSASGKADLTGSVSTVGGVATASYQDNGCAGNDTVTASVSGIVSVSETLSVVAPTAGSIQFDVGSLSPLSGIMNPKGIGQQETAVLTFKVLDSNGNPVGGKEVSFSLDTSIGGITFTPTTAISDPSTGNVKVSVQAGKISTPLRVSATVMSGSTKLTTQSKKLLISTGIPNQQNMSLSVSTFNLEGWDHDDVTSVLTARLADHFNNPVQDDTAVYFTTEGGSIGASCTTVAGACSVTLSSQDLRPTNGRLTVQAYTVGEEGFTDFSGDGMADGLSEMVDANNISTDMPEVFSDWNENGVRGVNEPFVDFNANGVYDVANGLYNGVLCNPNLAPGIATACNAQKSINVRDSAVLVFSGSTPFITIDDPFALAPCVNGTGLGASSKFVVTIVDLHGNAMPAGTTYDFTTNNGEIVSVSGEKVQSNTNRCRAGATGCPASAAVTDFGDHTVTMKSDATYDSIAGTCTNAKAEGALSVKIKMPKGLEVTRFVTVTD